MMHILFLLKLIVTECKDKVISFWFWVLVLSVLLISYKKYKINAWLTNVMNLFNRNKGILMVGLKNIMLVKIGGCLWCMNNRLAEIISCFFIVKRNWKSNRVISSAQLILHNNIFLQIIILWKYIIAIIANT